MLDKLVFEFSLQRKTTKGGGNEIINSNDRLHYHAKNKLTQHLRDMASISAKSDDYNHLSAKFNDVNTCTVIVDVQPPTKRRFDPPNIYPTVKALIDGFTDAGVFSDDNSDIIKMMSFKSSGVSGTKNYTITLTIEGCD